ncbi:hypothetical protein ACFRH6_14370 [Streptomyces sp. NPDC056749]|uniref:hypothetical protein n=1 Tax=Streptomyces sp. NPDC056749 TaxID=3345936 RepID=UPI0036B511FA
MTHTTDTADENRCSGCGHAHHGADVECEASVEHGPKHWHRCLCLARPYASAACPPPMHCQGGALGYTDVYYLQRGHTVSAPNGQKITPDVLKLAPWVDGDPLHEAIAAAIWERATTTEGSLVVDGPRNIAAVAATVARQVLGTTTGQPETEARSCGSAQLHQFMRMDVVFQCPGTAVDRATVLRELEARYRANAADSVHPTFKAAYAAVANDLSRLAAEAQQPEVEGAELTAEEAREMAADLNAELYQARDALAFVGECCDIADREQRPVTTGDVREWLKGARCGRQLAAAEAQQPTPAEETTQ